MEAITPAPAKLHLALTVNEYDLKVCLIDGTLTFNALSTCKKTRYVSTLKNASLPENVKHTFASVEQVAAHINEDPKEFIDIKENGQIIIKYMTFVGKKLNQKELELPMEMTELQESDVLSIGLGGIKQMVDYKIDALGRKMLEMFEAMAIEIKKLDEKIGSYGEALSNFKRQEKKEFPPADHTVQMTKKAQFYPFGAQKLKFKIDPHCPEIGFFTVQHDVIVSRNKNNFDSQWKHIYGNEAIPQVGKHYFELKLLSLQGTHLIIGLVHESIKNNAGITYGDQTIAYYCYDNKVYVDGKATASKIALAVGSILGVIVDRQMKKVTFYVDQSMAFQTELPQKYSFKYMYPHISNCRMEDKIVIV